MTRESPPPASFRLALASAARLQLLEGLPHPTFAQKALARELASQAVRHILCSPFYAEALSLRAEHEVEIRAILADPRTYRPLPGGPGITTVKLCGGFHADFALEFHAGAHVGAALICLGCGEVKTLLQAEHWHHDLVPEARDALQRILPGYRNRCPDPRADESAATTERDAISRSDALKVVGPHLIELEAYHRAHGRYPDALPPRREPHKASRGRIYYYSRAGGRHFWMSYSEHDRPGEIVFRSDAVPPAD